ncbi:MAG: UDP-N-acetylglucosamine 1-carboxyvinyltransferase [Candidatus Nealsonbacteria bacterium CG08_land_8_20_14_0_20_38_20]|uniref:UDP-N-acetylglucosamine 1-carboxyvinyltransferase n=1 Tax=Candidatus Nealsonbacteria bacterium CG08_land_8_20_14_0_20_38_20 TaxID=1974705 RepID=A0A2H0YME0_9BACT|nr:MAG: UDP-N-acetylglucosamine 1-carboxyvinyltransferase [Candidatus Nealsonbacteria bacterium CG08_land_8_20_14_0_20_38_20]
MNQVSVPKFFKFRNRESEIKNMAERFVIEGGRPLKGEIEVRGYKNAAGGVLAASLLCGEDCIIDEIPLVSDVLGLLKILEKMGSRIEWLAKRRIKINNGKIDPQKLDFEEVQKSRISVLLIGPLLSRFKDFRFPHPGGDRIGLRPISTHIISLKELGAQISRKEEFYDFKAEKILGKEVVLKEFSVTATENLMLAATLAQGKTIIEMAAAEPQVEDTGKFLKEMGAKIEGLGTNQISIEGVKKLRGAEHKIIPDPLEAGTFIIASAITGGEVKIKNVIRKHLVSFLDKLEEIGVKFKNNSDNSLVVSKSENFQSVKVQALPFPGFPTDLIPPLIPLLTQSQGRSTIHDPLYENRLNFTQELRKMGADIELVDPHRAFIFGKTPLQGSRIESWDIRAGASLIIAGLAAKGKTIIENISQIDRGYERIEERLQKLGADIKRLKI